LFDPIYSYIFLEHSRFLIDILNDIRSTASVDLGSSLDDLSPDAEL